MRDISIADEVLRLLLRDCLVLWSVPGRASVEQDGIVIEAADGRYVLRRAAPALHPVRWLVQTPARAAAGRPPRAASSIVAALSALRNALGAAGGAGLRIGAQ